MQIVQKNIGRYITKVHLENFQDHKDTEISLEPGINLITGSSDSGKSAILRAINFVFHNLPRGKSFIRYGSDECRVTVTFSDGVIVQRVKGEKNNSVLLWTKDAKDGKGEKFESIGNELPSKVIDALGKPPIDAKHGPLAYAEQMGPLFLVGLGTADLPRALSELTGIDNFQKAAEILGKRARASNTQIRDLTSRIENYKTQLVKYDSLEEEWDQMTAQEQSLERIKSTSALCVSAQSFVTQHNKIVMEARGVKDILQKTKCIADLKPKLEQILVIENKFKQAKSIEKAISLLTDNILNEELALMVGAKITSTSFKAKYCKAQDLSNKLKLYKSTLTDCTSISTDVKLVKTELDTLLKSTKEKESEFNTLVGNMRAQGLWCDVCDRPSRKSENG